MESDLNFKSNISASVLFIEDSKAELIMLTHFCFTLLKIEYSNYFIFYSVGICAFS